MQSGTSSASSSAIAPSIAPKELTAKQDAKDDKPKASPLPSAIELDPRIALVLVSQPFFPHTQMLSREQISYSDMKAVAQAVTASGKEYISHSDSPERDRDAFLHCHFINAAIYGDVKALDTHIKTYGIDTKIIDQDKAYNFLAAAILSGNPAMLEYVYTFLGREKIHSLDDKSCDDHYDEKESKASSTTKRPYLKLERLLYFALAWPSPDMLDHVLKLFAHDVSSIPAKQAISCLLLAFSSGDIGFMKKFAATPQYKALKDIARKHIQSDYKVEKFEIERVAADGAYYRAISAAQKMLGQWKLADIDFAYKAFLSDIPIFRTILRRDRHFGNHHWTALSVYESSFDRDEKFIAGVNNLFGFTNFISIDDVALAVSSKIGEPKFIKGLFANVAKAHLDLETMERCAYPRGDNPAYFYLFKFRMDKRLDYNTWFAKFKESCAKRDATGVFDDLLMFEINIATYTNQFDESLLNMALAKGALQTFNFLHDDVGLAIDAKSFSPSSSDKNILISAVQSCNIAVFDTIADYLQKSCVALWRQVNWEEVVYTAMGQHFHETEAEPNKLQFAFLTHILNCYENFRKQFPKEGDSTKENLFAAQYNENTSFMRNSSLLKYATDVLRVKVDVNTQRVDPWTYQRLDVMQASLRTAIDSGGYDRILQIIRAGYDVKQHASRILSAINEHKIPHEYVRNGTLKCLVEHGLPITTNELQKLITKAEASWQVYWNVHGSSWHSLRHISDSTPSKPVTFYSEHAAQLRELRALVPDLQLPDLALDDKDSKTATKPSMLELLAGPMVSAAIDAKNNAAKEHPPGGAPLPEAPANQPAPAKTEPAPALSGSVHSVFASPNSSAAKADTTAPAPQPPPMLRKLT